MTNVINKAVLELTLNKEVRDECYPSLSDLFKKIVESIGAEVSGEFGDVTISVEDPDSDKTYKMHIQTNGRRNDYAQRFFINGEWRPWYFLVPNQVVILDGRATIPDGFTKIGEFLSTNIPITDTSGTSALPEKFFIVVFNGYA
jgi:hypothetical protein